MCKQRKIKNIYCTGCCRNLWFCSRFFRFFKIVWSLWALGDYLRFFKKVFLEIPSEGQHLGFFSEKYEASDLWCSSIWNNKELYSRERFSFAIKNAISSVDDAMNVVNFMWLVHLNIEEGYLLDKRIFHCIPLCNKHFPVAGVNPHNFEEIDSDEPHFAQTGNGCHDHSHISQW